MMLQKLAVVEIIAQHIKTDAKRQIAGKTMCAHAAIAVKKAITKLRDINRKSSRKGLFRKSYAKAESMARVAMRK